MNRHLIEKYKMEKCNNAALESKAQEQRYTTYKITKIIIETMFAMFTVAV